MYFENRNDHVKYVLNFHVARGSKLKRENRAKDVEALMQEIVLENQDSQWLFVRNICNDLP